MANVISTTVNVTDGDQYDVTQTLSGQVDTFFFDNMEPSTYYTATPSMETSDGTVTGSAYRFKTSWLVTDTVTYTFDASSVPTLVIDATATETIADVSVTLNNETVRATYADSVWTAVFSNPVQIETEYTAAIRFESASGDVYNDTAEVILRINPSLFVSFANTYAGDNTMDVFTVGTPDSTDLEYTLDDGQTWEYVDLTQARNTITVPEDGTIRFRSTTGFSKDANNYISFQMSERHTLSGNIATLYDYRDIEAFTEIPDGCFANMCYYEVYLTASTLDWNGVTRIGAYGCQSMFSNCEIMTSTTDPFATVTNVGNYGCQSMFTGCVLLEHDFDLSAVTSVGTRAFQAFLNRCSLIDQMTAPNISSWDTDKFYNWLNNVAATGTMYKKNALSIPTNSPSGVPSGWTAVNTDIPYFTITNEDANSSYFTIKVNGVPATTDLEFSLDGNTWNRVDLSLSSTGISVESGGSLMLRSSTGLSNGLHNNVVIDSSVNHSVSGHIATLIDYTRWDSLTSIPDNCFYGLFNDDHKLISAENLTFNGITTIGNYSCTSMFTACNSLKNTPDFSSVTTIGTSGLTSAFYGCLLLEKSLDLKNVTSVGNNGCLMTYYNCNILDDVTAPNISSWNTSNFSVWLNNVAANGTFYKPAALSVPVGTSGVPSGWTVVNY